MNLSVSTSVGHANTEASPWVVLSVERYLASRRGPSSADRVASGVGSLKALDLACGGGRHSKYLASLGFEVHAVDRQVPVESLGPGVIFEQIDLELPDAQTHWPLPTDAYDLIVVTNYLHRPTFHHLCGNLKPGGVLIYETFMDGNAQFGSPKNPDFLLRSGELLELTKPLQVLAFEQGMRVDPSMAMIQRAMCIKGHWTEIQSLTRLKTAT